MQNPTQNKQLIRTLYEEGINSGKYELFAQLVSEDYIGIQGEKGPRGFADNIQSLRRGFPDIRFTLEDVIAEDDRVSVRWQWQGTHQGPFRGFAGSQKRVTNDGIVIYQISDGKIVRAWLQADRLGVLQEIGVIPKDLGALART